MNGKEGEFEELFVTKMHRTISSQEIQDGDEVHHQVCTDYVDSNRRIKTYWDSNAFSFLSGFPNVYISMSTPGRSEITKECCRNMVGK